MYRPLKLLYNATFTENGRKNVKFRFRHWKLHSFTEYPKGKPAIWKMRSGMQFIVFPNDELSLSAYLAGEYEPVESRVVALLLRPGDSGLDVGANVGYFTTLMANAIGRDGHVYACEPGPKTFGKLGQTIQLLGLNQVVPCEVALGSKSGELEFLISKSGRDAQQSLNDWSGFAGDKERVKVRMLMVDDLLKELEVLPDTIALVKCDIEGAEKQMLLGARGLLGGSSPPIFLIELNQPALKAAGATAHEVLSFFQNYDLYYKNLNEQEFLLYRFEPTRSALPEIANFFCFPKTGAYASRGRDLWKNAFGDSVLRVSR